MNNSMSSQGSGHARPEAVVYHEPRMPLHAPVLVLNASYEPINVCAARRAIILVLKGVARAEEENGNYMHAARVAMRIPSVIRLLEYRRIPHQTRALSRKNILLRDRNTCQYCGTILGASDLTLDHVLPRSRGGGVVLGKSCGMLPRLQPPQRESVAARSQYEVVPRAALVQLAYQPPHHAHDGPLRRQVAQVLVLLIDISAG